MAIVDDFGEIGKRLQKRESEPPSKVSDSEALLIVADNVEGFWCDLAEQAFPGVRDVAVREAAHLREIAARIKGK